MIPVIGLMIGAYILTRMIENLIKKETHPAVAIFSFITIAVVAFGLFDLVTRSA